MPPKNHLLQRYELKKVLSSTPFILEQSKSLCRNISLVFFNFQLKGP